MARTKKAAGRKGKQSNTDALDPKKQVAPDEPNSPQTSTLASSNDKPLLLEKLSGELRNHIWRDVLVVSEPVCVRVDGPHQPALLRTCAQIREEATAIYFSENTFELPMDGYDSTLGMKWCTIARPHLRAGMSHIGWKRETGTETWDDLKTWLLRAHLGQVPRYSPTYYPIGCDEDAEQMFDFLEDFVGQPWRKAEKAIEERKRDMERELEFPLFDNPGSDF